MENHRRERLRKKVDVLDGQRRHLGDRAQRVALSAALNAEEADRVGVVQIDGDLSPRNLTDNPVLRRWTGYPEEYVIVRGPPGAGSAERRFGLLHLRRRRLLSTAAASGAAVVS